jgi:hypothetical protein
VPDRVWRPDVDTAGVQESAEAVVEAAVLAVAVQEDDLSLGRRGPPVTVVDGACNAFELRHFRFALFLASQT